MLNTRLQIQWQKIFLLLVVLLLSYTGFTQARVRTIDYDEDKPEAVD